MTVPGWRDWAFSIKTFAAAMLALFLAFWIDLPKPYWAVGTVYITSQVLAGATRSKAVYRGGGTLLGGVVTVILVPNRPLRRSPAGSTPGCAMPACGPATSSAGPGRRRTPRPSVYGSPRTRSRSTRWRRPCATT